MLDRQSHGGVHIIQNSSLISLKHMDSNQFAAAGKSTDQASALVYILHLALEALDKWNCSQRFFLADFRKGFDLID